MFKIVVYMYLEVVFSRVLPDIVWKSPVSKHQISKSFCSLLLVVLVYTEYMVVLYYRVYVMYLYPPLCVYMVVCII